MKVRRFFDTELWSWIRTVLELILIGVIILGIIVFLQYAGIAEEDGEEVWVLCQPDSYVTLRAGPSKNSRDFGGAQCGSRMLTNGKMSGSFLKVFDLSAEETSGWISTRYIVYDEPEEVNMEMEVDSDGRVACRKNINGKIIGWVNDGDIVFAYWSADEWTVTNKGYIQSRFLVMEENIH